MKKLSFLLISAFVSSQAFSAPSDDTHLILSASSQKAFAKASEQGQKCHSKALKLESLDVFATHYFGRTNTSGVENLRSSGEYRKDGRNILGVLPNGSLVKKMSNPNDQNYIKIKVVSVAKVDSQLDHALTVGTEAFIHINSLKNISDYSLKSNSVISESSENMAIQLDKNQNIPGLECPSENGSEQFVNFQIQNPESEIKTVSLSLDKLDSLENAELTLNDSDSTEVVLTAKRKKKKRSRTKAVSGSRNKIICTSSGSVANVYNRRKKKIGTRKNGLSVKVYQGRDARKFKRGRYNYTRVLVSGNKTPVWIATTIVKNEQSCKSIKKSRTRSTGSSYACAPNGGRLNARTTNSRGNRIGSVDSRVRLNSGDKITRLTKHKPSSIRKKIGRKTYKFVPISINRKRRWIPESFISKNSCGGSTSSSGGSVKGQVFPLAKRPLYNYRTGQRRFGAGRSKGRTHAATDLWTRYRNKKNRYTSRMGYDGGSFRSIGNGRAVRGSTPFYLNTNYIAVRDSSTGKVWRYGEIYPNRVRKGQNVRAGQTLGRIKWVGIGSVPPMLHLEGFRGTLKSTRNGTLSGGGRYKRAGDLFNPTKDVQRLERKTFGKSW